MIATIKQGKADGIACAPPSKSIAHRMLICAGLANGHSVIRGIDESEDISATLDCLRALGATCTCSNGIANVTGIDSVASCTSTLPCRESGSTMRFFIPICMLSRTPHSLSGSNRLLARPLDVYASVFATKKLIFKNDGKHVNLQGPLTAGSYEIRGDVSSQFISGLLFALPRLDNDSRILIKGEIESRSYIDLTIDALRTFGVEAVFDEKIIFVRGKQKYIPNDVTIPGDESNAAFLEALNFLGGNVKVTGLSSDSIQGDRVFRELFKQLAGGTPTISLADCPDLGPILFTLAAALHGAVFTDTRRLRLKESDRITAMTSELEKFGARIENTANVTRITANALHAPSSMLSGHNDHRIVMSLAVLLTKFGGKIDGAEAVRKSWPNFFTTLNSQLGVSTYFC